MLALCCAELVTRGFADELISLTHTWYETQAVMVPHCESLIQYSRVCNRHQVTAFGACCPDSLTDKPERPFTAAGLPPSSEDRSSAQTHTLLTFCWYSRLKQPGQVCVENIAANVRMTNVSETVYADMQVLDGQLVKVTNPNSELTQSE